MSIPTILRTKWFEWLFVAVPAVVLIACAWRSDHTLSALLHIATEWQHPSRHASLSPGPPDSAAGRAQVRVVPLDPETPTEVRVVGVGPPPPYRVALMVRMQGAANAAMTGEASYKGNGQWTAIAHLDNSACRNAASGVPADHVTYLIALSAHPTMATARDATTPDGGQNETAYQLACRATGG